MKVPKVFGWWKNAKNSQPGNFRVEFDKNLNRKVCVIRRSDKRGRDELASFYSELLVRNNERNQWGGGCSEIIEPRASTITERNEKDIKKVSITNESDVVRPTAKFPIVGLKSYDNSEKTRHRFQANQVVEKPMLKKAEREENFEEAELNFMIELKTPLQNTLVGPKEI